MAKELLGEINEEEIIHDAARRPPPSSSPSKTHGPGARALRIVATLCLGTLCIPSFLGTLLIDLALLAQWIDATTLGMPMSQPQWGDVHLILFGPLSVASWGALASAAWTWIAGGQVPRWILATGIAAGLASLGCLRLEAAVPVVLSVPAFALLSIIWLLPAKK